MFKRIGRLTTAHPWLVCLSWLVVGGVLNAVAPTWDSKAQDDDIHFLPARCASVRGFHLLEKAFPQDVFASRLIFAVERKDGELTSDDFALVDRLTAELERLKKEESDLQIRNITSYHDGLVGSRLTSADKHCSLIQVSLGTPFLALQTRESVERAHSCLREIVRKAGSGAPELMATGPAGIGRDLTKASAQGLESTTLATIVLVIVVLLLVYRAPLLALVPLATIAVSVWVALQLLALLTLIAGIHLVNVSKVFAIVILYGSGTDYCLFLISHYQENLAKGQKEAAALRRTVGAVGGALAASAATVVCGLGLMGLAEFAKVRCAGPAIGLSLAVALVASLTLTPALLTIAGRFVFWPARIPQFPAKIHNRGLRGPGSGRRDPIWERLSRGVVKRPLLVWTVAVVVLAPLAILGSHVEANYKPTGELSPQSDSVRGLAAIQKHFTAGEIGPLTVLLVSPTDWSGDEGKKVIDHLSRGFARLPNVAEVRSLTQPLGKPMQIQPASLAPKRLFGGYLASLQKDVSKVIEKAGAAAKDFYVASLHDEQGSQFITRLDVVLNSDPFDKASNVTVSQIQTWLNEDLPREARAMGALKTECYGVSVNAHDLAEITEADRSRVNYLVLGGVFLILLFLVRQPWLAAYLLITVLFSYYATLGATTLMATLWSGKPLGQVDWRVPFFLFTILVAVGEDYNIFLVSRMLEERRKFGTDEGTRRALAFTGGTITSCGLIMAGTFATLMLSQLNTLVQIGFALAFGVLLDTFVVRPFLVPAFTLLVWRQEEKAAATASSPRAPAVRRKAG